MKNFGIIGIGGYIAPRHLKAIKETGNKVIAALDPHDSVGIIDSFFPKAKFFTEFERFDRHCEKIRRNDSQEKIDYLTICSPNYLHDSHIRFGLRIGANVICEKPIVLNPRNVSNLIELEKESGKKVYTVLQLRYHQSIIALKNKIEKNKDKKYKVELTYITPRGDWYLHSWKGNIEKSGGIATNIGIHFFDMLLWIFGPVKSKKVFLSEAKKMSGHLELENADVKWYLSTDSKDLPKKNIENNSPYRSIKVNDEEIEFSKGFTELHTETYKQILNGNGFRIKDAEPSISLVSQLRDSTAEKIDKNKAHYMLKNE